MDLINDTKDKRLIKPNLLRKLAESPVLTSFQRVSPV